MTRRRRVSWEWWGAFEGVVGRVSAVEGQVRGVEGAEGGYAELRGRRGWMKAEDTMPCMPEDLGRGGRPTRTTPRSPLEALARAYRASRHAVEAWGLGCTPPRTTTIPALQDRKSTPRSQQHESPPD